MLKTLITLPPKANLRGWLFRLDLTTRENLVKFKTSKNGGANGEKDKVHKTN